MHRSPVCVCGGVLKHVERYTMVPAVDLSITEQTYMRDHASSFCMYTDDLFDMLRAG